MNLETKISILSQCHALMLDICISEDDKDVFINLIKIRGDLRISLDNYKSKLKESTNQILDKSN